MSKILVDAPSRTMRELYGDPPSGLFNGYTPDDPTCAPNRGSQLTGIQAGREWYAEQEAIHGRYAALKSQRPKSSGWFGRKSELEQETQLVVVDNPQSVQDKLRKMRMLPGGNTETTTQDGYYWFTIKEEESEVSR